MKRLILIRAVRVLIAVISLVSCSWSQEKWPVIHKYAGKTAPLHQRWKWAMEEGKIAQPDDGFWIGYSITKRMRENEFYGDGCIYKIEGRKTIRQLIEGDTVIKLEEADEKEELKKATLLALKKLGDQKAANRLREEGYDEEKLVKKELAILALHGTEGRTIRLQDLKLRRMDQGFDAEGKMLFWLGHAENEESVDLLWDIFSEAEAIKLQKRVVTAIGVHDAPNLVVPVLEKVTYGDYPRKVRENAIFWLGQQKGKESLKILKRLLGDERDTKIREKIIFAIHEHGGDEAVSILANTAKKDPNTKVRKKAIFWLGQMAAQKTLDVLADIIVDSEETEIQEYAVFAISQHSNTEAVPLLIKIVKTHPNPEVRKRAIFWLGQTEDERALNFLVELLRDNSSEKD